MRFEKIWCWKLRRRLWRDTIWKNCKNLTTWPKMIGSRGNDPKVTPYALSALGAANFLAGASLVSHPRDLPVLCKVAAEGDEDDPLAPFWAMTRSLRESWQLVLFPPKAAAPWKELAFAIAIGHFLQLFNAPTITWSHKTCLLGQRWRVLRRWTPLP